MTSRIDEQLSKGFIHFSAILEIVGKPKEHVDSTFVDFISQMKKSMKYEIVNSTIHEAIEVEGSENLYSSFAELEVLAKNMGALFDFCFECMPASIEILAPSELKLKPNQASAAVNDLVGRIHHLDLQSKQLTQQITLYSQNLRIMIENAIVIYLMAKPHTVESISKAVGVGVDQLPSFMKNLIDKGRITENNGVYGISGKNISQTPAIMSSKDSQTKSKKENVISNKPSSKAKNKKKGKK